LLVCLLHLKGTRQTHAAAAGVQNSAPALSVTYAPGCTNVACSSNAGFAAATAAAAAADLTIVAVGIDQTGAHLRAD
jgi:hypothetical protein